MRRDLLELDNVRAGVRDGVGFGALRDKQDGSALDVGPQEADGFTFSFITRLPLSIWTPRSR